MALLVSFALALIVLVSPIVQGTAASRVSFTRRATSNLPPLKTLNMPLTFDSEGRYTLPVRMVSSRLLKTL